MVYWFRRDRWRACRLNSRVLDHVGLTSDGAFLALKVATAIAAITAVARALSLTSTGADHRMILSQKLLLIFLPFLLLGIGLGAFSLRRRK